MGIHDRVTVTRVMRRELISKKERAGITTTPNAAKKAKARKNNKAAKRAKREGRS